MSFCKRCGKCCWNWISGDRTDRCEYLADDDVTCTIFGRWDEFGLGTHQCVTGPRLSGVSSLPPECGFAQQWLSEGLIEEDPDNPGRWRQVK